MTNTIYTELKEKVLPTLRKYVSQKRLNHILSVTQESVRICEKLHREDLIESVIIASLLHDISREYSLEYHIEFSTTRNFDFNDEDIATPGVLHALTGCELARELFPSLVDEKVYHAIKFHCTGRENMSIQEKIVFLADYIEPSREYVSCQAARVAFYADSDTEHALNRAVMNELSNIVKHLREKNLPLNSRTLQALNYYEKENNMEKLTPKELALQVVKILNDKNAAEMKLLHVGDKTVIADYFVLCTGMSNTQVKSYADEVEYRLGELGITPHHIEGFADASWVVLDYSSVIVHVFYKEARDFYSLDKVWADAEEIDISDLITEK